MAERPEDLNLPNAVIAKIIKEALPDGVNVSKDARLAISKAASVFVLYATSCANNFAMQQKRKTISSADVFNAMKEMEFERFNDPLKQSLESYKVIQKRKKDATDTKKKGQTSTKNAESEAIEVEEDAEEPDEERTDEQTEEVGGEGDDVEDVENAGPTDE